MCARKHAPLNGVEVVVTAPARVYKILVQFRPDPLIRPGADFLHHSRIRLMVEEKVVPPPASPAPVAMKVIVVILPLFPVLGCDPCLVLLRPRWIEGSVARSSVSYGRWPRMRTRVPPVWVVANTPLSRHWFNTATGWATCRGIRIRPRMGLRMYPRAPPRCMYPLVLSAQ